MAGSFSDLPFPIGTTFSAFGTAATTDGPQLVGREFVIPDLDYSVQPAKPRSYHAGEPAQKTVRIVRNSSAGTLQARRLVTFKTGEYGQEVGGYATTTAAECYPVDDFLTGAVPANDLFYITVAGPAECMTDLAAGADNLIPAETILVALTAVTSGSTTSGRVAPQSLAGATAVLGVQLQNAIGVALTARTTANTNSSILVHIWKRL